VWARLAEYVVARGACCRDVSLVCHA
jgi:hypothetical protein